SEEQDFISSSLGVMEPNPETAHAVKLTKNDVVLVPGVVFNKGRYRIGRGKGFYDRFLATTDAYSVGIAYDLQLLDEDWPRKPWDKQLQMVMTELQTIEENRDGSKGTSFRKGK
ncbi:MAG: 5-formyltetrahydrofolate cyclo-ligase, partial [Bdellovibrionales bacterium]|nr:5-formyltetrahydrofolate cyclo-ligase [Bdellovibrionales bacterium]